MPSWPEGLSGFEPAVKSPSTIPENALYFVFDGQEIYQQFDASGSWIPLARLDPLMSEIPSDINNTSHYLGEWHGVACYALSAVLPKDKRAGLRSLFGKVEHHLFSLAGRALQVLDWYRTHKFCGRCGAKAEVHQSDRAMICAHCCVHSYPRLSPSIITLVHDEGRVLLARNHNFPKDMYSTLAGFVEPGESIEETVAREVREEVGVEVSDLEYIGSQPWPFPNSLMLGFFARYESGDIVLQEDEIADAQWFDCDALPTIPGPVAISRWLIDRYLHRRGISHVDH